MRVKLETKLRGDPYTIPNRSERLADQFFVGEGAVDLRRVEEGDAPLDRRVQERDHFGFVANRRVAKAHSHAAQAEG